MTPEQEKTIRNTIMGMDKNDLTAVQKIVNGEWDALQAQEMAKYRAGMKVEFIGHGRSIAGVIDKINKKTLSVGKHGAACSDGRLWNIAPTSVVRVLS